MITIIVEIEEKNGKVYVAGRGGTDPGSPCTLREKQACEELLLRLSNETNARINVAAWRAK